jgi:hypothetical protein
MKRHTVLFAVGAVLLTTIAAPCRGDEIPAGNAEASSGPIVSEASSPSIDPAILAEVSRMVELSLEALRDGREYRHVSLLKESLAKLSDFAPARWQSSYVWLDGTWLHISEVPTRVGNSLLLKQYAELRDRADARNYPRTATALASGTRLVGITRADQLIRVPAAHRSNDNDRGAATNGAVRTEHWRREHGTFVEENLRLINTSGFSPAYVGAQASLARWCSGRGLTEEARAHWMQVLQGDPGNREAARALGMVEFGGRFLSQEQSAAFQRRQQAVAASLQKWREKLQQLRRESTMTQAQRRTRALAELHKINETDSIFALESVALREALADRQAPSRVEEFCRAAVDVVAQLDTPLVAETLTRFAVLHPVDRVRAAAAEHLNHRELNEFVPLLLDGLTMPIHYDATVVVDPLGQKQIRAGVIQEREDFIAGIRDVRNVYDDSQLRRLAMAALARKEQVEQFNVQADLRNRRIVAVLARCVPIDPGGPFADLTRGGEFATPDPQRWWSWWYDYNEQYVSPDKPYYGYDYGYAMYDGPDYIYQVPPRRLSCFAKGTIVWTVSGPRPIEKLRLGDRVLSQNVETGELTYKAVLATTIRPPSKMLQITSGDTCIAATLGHPFFVVGKGWRMAKELALDDWVCVPGDAVPIDSIEEAKPAEAYNLVVADFGTYFVGKDRMLVHDNSPLKAARLDMPGLVASNDR